MYDEQDRYAENTPPETVTLLNTFKKPTFPAALGKLSGAQGERAGSRASTCSFVITPLQRQSSILSQRSNTSAAIRKRKIDMSDDDQSDYEPSSSSSKTARKKPASSLGSPFKKQLRPRVPPPPSASLASPAGKKTNGLSFRTKSTAMTTSTPSTPTGPSTKRAKPAKPVKPTRESLSARDKALSTPPSKRKAAVRAPFNVQKMMEADKAFQAEDNKSTVKLGTRLRSMSITPVPTGARFREDTVADESVYAREKFLKYRTKGAKRLANRTRDIGKLIGEDSDEVYEDLDTSEFSYVGGLILMKGQENRLTDM
jgi:hypothetical protein